MFIPRHQISRVEQSDYKEGITSVRNLLWNGNLLCLAVLPCGPLLFFVPPFPLYQTSSAQVTQQN